MRAGIVALGLAAAPAIAEPKLDYVGTFVWERPESYFGGWSAIEVQDGGASFIAIGDNAQIFEGSFARNGRKIAAIPKRPIGALRDIDGVPYFQKNGIKLGDSEGVALLPDGRIAISFERDHRILFYRGDEAIVRAPENPQAVGLPLNRGVEALAVDSSGRLVAIPEAAPPGAPGFPVWRLDGERWETVFHVTRTQGFRPVGADVDPQGMLFLLERAFRLIGFQNRIRRFNLDDPSSEGEVIWQPAMTEFDNLEGLSVWPDNSGGLRLTLISDDNYQRFQETQIVEFRLTE
ncbi:MAG: esterase-like activity of phytase family protein [Boseongicola sp.]